MNHPMQINFLNNLNKIGSRWLVLRPYAEGEGIKERMNKGKEKLQTKLEDEVNNQWVESTHARKMLGVSAKTWQDYRDKRVIPFSQFGRKIYVRRADIEAFMQKHYIKSRKESKNEDL